jgi:hypothetical protein
MGWYGWRQLDELGERSFKKRLSENVMGTTGFDDYMVLYESHLHGQTWKVTLCLWSSKTAIVTATLEGTSGL